MKVLVTSSTGLTGKAVVKALSSRGTEVRAMIHSSRRSEEMLSIGASETVVGEISSHADLLSAMKDVDVVYYICPTAHEDEAKIGRTAIAAAKESGISKFVYQSVLHSIEPELPHHRQKLEIEKALVDSGLPYSIVQPAPFMQNILNTKEILIRDRTFIQKFFIGINSTNRINLIDVKDFGDCVAEIISDSQCQYTTLELCGPENLSATEMLSAIERVLGSHVRLEYISDDEIIKSMSDRKASDYSIDTLLRMFRHYNSGDFCGSPYVSSLILNRRPTTFLDFITRELK